MVYEESGCVEMKLKQLSELLGFSLGNESFYIEAFTHKSYSKFQSGIPHNERLEFLGDAVLKIIVSEYLFKAISRKARR